MTKHREPSPVACLAAILATEIRQTPYKAACHAESLVRLGKRAHRIAENLCNGIERYDSKAGRVVASWTESDETAAEKSRERIEREARDILAEYGATGINASGDPRGFCLRFRLASGRSNSFDRETWGV
jgi:hypothetical protein